MDALDSIDHERIGRAMAETLESDHIGYDEDGNSLSGSTLRSRPAETLITELEALGYTIVRKPIV